MKAAPIEGNFAFRYYSCTAQHLTDDQITEMIRKRTHLDESNYDRIVTATEIGVKPDGSIRSSRFN